MSPTLSASTCSTSLAPGGHLGQFVIWTEPAFKKLDEVYGSLETPSLKKKNAAAVLKLTPYFRTARRMAVLAEAARVNARKDKIDSKRTKLSALLGAGGVKGEGSLSCSLFEQEEKMVVTSDEFQLQRSQRTTLASLISDCARKRERFGLESAISFVCC